MNTKIAPSIPTTQETVDAYIEPILDEMKVWATEKRGELKIPGQEPWSWDSDVDVALYQLQVAVQKAKDLIVLRRRER